MFHKDQKRVSSRRPGECGPRGTSGARSAFGCEPLETRMLFAGGALDTSFLGTGHASAPGTGVANDVAVQADGKTIVAGIAPGGGLQVVRYNLNGSLDRSFGPDHTGIVTTPFEHNPFNASVVIQPDDGKIVVSGYYDPDKLFTTQATAVTRYNPDGTLDPSFDDDGKLTFEDMDTVSMSVYPGGSVVLGGPGNGGVTVFSKDDFAFTRLRPNGSPDPTMYKKFI